ncbi:hypothetical protein MBRA1_002014 [Malassezia brasiliensis]|uniref:Protein PBN1 n=1 Tax=Malassezia brasiliensis TaxID=1821822 RepID=A0AAF0DV53_9BASI|nr:hypothetical protein MBRA1_002014 [Malassezia brasiliensis]
MDPTVEYAAAARRSFAPRLAVTVPGEIAHAEQCTVYVAAPLSPDVFFDPYTARMERTEPVSDVQLLGHLELEKPVGWATDAEVGEAEISAEEVSAPTHSSATCHGPTCEHSAVLLELARGAGDAIDTQVHIPLHVRYHPARIPHRDASHAHVHGNEDSAHGAAHAVAHAAHRFYHTWATSIVPRIRRWGEQHYDHVPIIADGGPIVFAACASMPDTMVWREVNVDDVLPSTHAHLRTELRAALAPNNQALYMPRTLPRATTEMTTPVPIGNVTLYPAVLALTLLAVLWATRSVMHSVRRAVGA